jgi:hypothetical protein
MAKRVYINSLIELCADVTNTGLQSGVQGVAGGALAAGALASLISGPAAMSVSSLNIDNDQLVTAFLPPLRQFSEKSERPLFPSAC